MAKHKTDKGNTYKKQRIKTEQTIKNEQGQIETVSIVEIDDADCNFKKIWLGAILQVIDEIGNAKIKILSYLLDVCDYSHDNLIIKNQREIANDTNLSIQTVNSTLKALKKHNIVNYKANIIQLNPNVIFKGSHDKRMSVLFRYNQRFDDITTETAEIITDKMIEKARSGGSLPEDLPPYDRSEELTELQNNIS